MGKLLRLGIGCALLASGCGQLGPGLQAGSGGLRALDDPATGIRESLSKAYGDLETLTGRVTYRELDPKDSKVHGSVATFKTDKGRRWIRGLVEESDKPNTKGAQTLFFNDGKITVRVKIGFVPITKTFPLGDPQVTSARNYRLDQTDFAAMVGTVLATGSTLVPLGPGQLLGRAVDLLDVSPAGLPDATHERVGLDPATHLPVAREAYAPKAGWLLLGPEEAVIFSAALSAEKLDENLPPSTWKF